MKNTTSLTTEKILSCCKNYLIHREYEDVQVIEGSPFDLIANDEGETVAFLIAAHTDSLEEFAPSREEVEAGLFDLIIRGLTLTGEIRVDALTIRQASEKSALLKHHRNALAQ